MWQWELLSTRGQTMPTKGLIFFLKHISSLAGEIACFFCLFFPEPTTWCIQFQTVLELSKSHPESTRYSSLVLEKCAAIMNIMTAFVYRAGRQDRKVSLLMTNIKEMSVFRDGGNYVYCRLKSNFFNVRNSWNDPAPVLKKGLWKNSPRDGSVKVWVKAQGNHWAVFQARHAPGACPLHISLLPSVFEKTGKRKKALLSHTKAQSCLCPWLVVTG